MSEERLHFSKRLATAMQAAGYEARPTVLMKLFNSRYTGPSVTFQTVSRWLRGDAIPSQDKLKVLASLFRLDPQLLRYGQPTLSAGLREQGAAWPVKMSADDRGVIDRYLALPKDKQQLVAQLVRSLSDI